MCQTASPQRPVSSNRISGASSWALPLTIAIVVLQATSELFAGGMVGIRMKDSPAKNGVVIEEVFPGSPADQAGLRTYSRITHVNFQVTNDMDGFRRALDPLPAGTKVQLTVDDDGSLSNVSLSLAAPNARFTPTLPDESVKEALAEVQDISGSIQTDHRQPSRPAIGVTVGARYASDTSLKIIAGLNQLRTLKIEDWNESAKMTGASLVEFKRVPRLRKLSLPRAKLTTEIAKHLCELSQIESLELDGAKVTPEALEVLAKNLKLKELTLREVELTDSDMVSIGQMTGLRKLDLYGTKLRSAGLAQLKSLSKLTYLDLDRTNMTDVDAEYLKDLVELEDLDLSHTGVTDGALPHLQKLTAMRALGLNETGKIEPGLYEKTQKQLDSNSSSASPGSPIGAAFGEFAPTGKSSRSMTHGITATGLESNLKNLTDLRDLQVIGPEFEPSDVRRFARVWPKARIVTSHKTILPPREQR